MAVFHACRDCIVIAWLVLLNFKVLPVSAVVDLVPDFGTVSCPPGGEASKACPRGTITFTCTANSTTGALVWLTSLTGVDTATYRSTAMIPSPQTLSDPNVTLFQTVLLQNGPTLISNLTVTEEFRAQAAMGAVTAVDITCQDNFVGGANVIRTLEISQDRPSPPMNVRRSPLDLCSAPLDTITVEWDCSISTGGTDITRYTVIVDGLRNYTVEDGRSVTITGLPPNTNYTVFVTAENCAGESPSSNPTYVFNSTVPDAPSNLTYQLVCSALTSSTTPVDISWQNPPGNQALLCPVTQVCVNCSGVNCMSECRSTPSNPYRFDTVSGENYTAYLSLANGIDQSELSDPLQFVVSVVQRITSIENTGRIQLVLSECIENTTAFTVNVTIRNDTTSESMSRPFQLGPTEIDFRDLVFLDFLVYNYTVTVMNSDGNEIYKPATGTLGTQQDCTRADLDTSGLFDVRSSCPLEYSESAPVVCYTGLRPGSTAMYYCDCEERTGSRRTCRPDGTWSGDAPTCDRFCPDPPGGGVVNDDCSIASYCGGFAFADVNIQFDCSIPNLPWGSTSPSCNASGGLIALIIILILLIIALLVGIGIAVIIYKKWNKGKKDEDMELKEPSPDSSPAADSGPPPAVYADPNTIQREEFPGTQDVYTVPDKKKKKHKPEDHLPTYQDPSTISHEVAPTGDMYAQPDKAKKPRGSKKNQQEAPPPSEEQLAEMYSQPDKSKKQQNQGLTYTHIDFHGSGKVPDTQPGVVYSDVKPQ